MNKYNFHWVCLLIYICDDSWFVYFRIYINIYFVLVSRFNSLIRIRIYSLRKYIIHESGQRSREWCFKASRHVEHVNALMLLKSLLLYEKIRNLLLTSTGKIYRDCCLDTLCIISTVNVKSSSKKLTRLMLHNDKLESTNYLLYTYHHLEDKFHRTFYQILEVAV